MVTGYLDNYYARLGIPNTATQEEIRSAYHLAARKFHPDRNKDQHASEVFMQIQEAYDTLSDAVKRATYDSKLPRDIKSPKNVLINAIYSRQTLTEIDRPQLIYVLLNIAAAPHIENQSKRQPLNICLVLDTSTSMSGSRLNAVKETALQIIQTLKPEDILSVVTFDDRAEVIIPANREQNINVLSARISIITPGGGTEIFKGLKAGYKQITQNLRPTYNNHIILITDGRTYGDERDCLMLAKRAVKKGIQIHTLGIGNEWNDDFMDQLATSTGGGSEFAETSNAIQKFLQDKFGKIQNSFANNVSLELNIPENVELRYAFRLTPDSSSISIEDTLALGDIPRQVGLNVLMEFVIKSTAQQKEILILDGNLNFLMPSAAIPNFSSRLTLSKPVTDNPQPEPPPQVLVRAMSRLSLYRLQEMANSALKDGDVLTATNRLKNLATQLLSSGESNLAQTVMLELDHVRTSHDMNDDVRKQIKYGTRALVLDDTVEES